jgi:hypothetical protein
MRPASWLKMLSLIIALLMPPERSFAAEEVELSVGEFYRINEYGIQPFTVKNNTDKMLKIVEVECGYFLRGTIIAADNTYVTNIRAMGKGFGKVFHSMGGRADSVECRVVFE